MDRIARALASLGGTARLGAGFATGGLSALALPPLDAFPVLWITMPALVWLLDGAIAAGGPRRTRRFGAAALVGWAFGFGYFVCGLWWIGAAFLVDGDQFAFLLPLAVTILPAGLALFWGLAAGIVSLLWQTGWRRILVFAAAFAALEWLRGHVLTGFPWNAFGYAIAPTPVMMQSASVVGLWGLTLAAFVIFAAPAALAPATERRGGLPFAAAAALVLAAHLGFGLARLSAAGDRDDPGPSLRLVQPSLEQSEKWQAENEDEIVARYLELSIRPGPLGQAIGAGTILIWPESAFPFLLSERPEVLETIGEMLPAGATLVTGAVRARDPSRPWGEAFNSVLVIDDRGAIVAAYDKVHLVPFGEYLPFRRLLEAIGLRQLVALPEGFTPGAARMMLTLPGASPFVPLICYEIIFPGETLPDGPRPGWILNLTNDGWFGMTPGPYQHFLQARLRAVETGLPMVRAANSGISAIVDAYGRIRGMIPLGVAGILDESLPGVAASTLYTRVGDGIFFGILVIIIVVAGRRRGLREVTAHN